MQALRRKAGGQSERSGAASWLLFDRHRRQLFSPALRERSPVARGLAMFPRNGGSSAFGNVASTSSSFNTAPPNSANGAPAGPAVGSRGRGRGRGAPRGTARGAGAFGVQRHTNLSWRKPDDTAPTAPDETVEVTAPNPEASTSAFGSGGSAFTAFGAAANGGFGTSSGAKQDGSSSSAFGAAPSAFTTTAFGSSAPPGPPNPFASAAASTSSAFPSSSAQSPFGAGSAFALLTSAASDGPLAVPSMPLFRAASPGGEGGGGGGGASLGDATAAAKKRNPAQISTLEVLGEDSDARKKRFEATLPNNRYLEVRAAPAGPVRDGRVCPLNSFVPATRS